MKRYLITEEGYIAEEISLAVSPDRVPSADFDFQKPGEAVVIRWSRTAKYAYVPSEISGHKVTKIAPMAFASMHLPESVWDSFLSGTSLSFSIFCMMNSGKMSREGKDDGGPVLITLPETLEEIGCYAFWHCDRLQSIKLPSKITHLREGVFGECSQLQEVVLPSHLEEIGAFYPDTMHAMPDVGCFAGCRSLKELTLPKTVTSIGVEVFNSSGIENIIVEDIGDNWSKKCRVHASAFHHTASLQWLSRKVLDEIVWQIGLPVSRDKILNCDKKYNIISKLPVLFFEKTPQEIDLITMKSFRLDFAGRMAIARLRYPKFLEKDRYQWYQNLIVNYFDKLEQFWPGSGDKAEEAFSLLCESKYFTAELLGRLMYIAGKTHIRTELIFKMQEIRNTRFVSTTGLEDLEL